MNKAASDLAKLGAKKRRAKMGEKAYKAWMKQIRNTPPKQVIPTSILSTP